MWRADSDRRPMTTPATLIWKKRHPIAVRRLLENGSLGFNALKGEVDGVTGEVQPAVLEEFAERARRPDGRQREAVPRGTR